MKSLGPTCPWYWDDFLGGTLHMEAFEIGAYVLLLGEQWKRGFVQNSDKNLKRISRISVSKLKQVVEKFYVDSDGNLRNRKMEIIRAERMDYISTQSVKGKRSAANRGSTVVQPQYQPDTQPDDLKTAPLPSSSASPLVKDIEPEVIGFTLSQCLAAAVSLCMKAEDATAFFNHFDSFGWIGSQNRKITRLHSALAKWKANQPSHGKKYSEDAPKQQPAWARLKAAKEERDSIAGSTNHPSDQQRARIGELNKLIIALNKEIQSDH